MYGYGYSYPNNPQGNGLLGRYEAGVRSDGGSFAFPIDTGLASRLEGLGLLNASSLVNSCNAGKESVLYNLVPTPVQALDRFTVSRAGTKWVLGADGLLTEVQANFPAFEYNADGTYRGLWVEPAGTNLALRSQEFDNASWIKTSAGTGVVPVVTPNVAVAPDGTTTADLIVFDRGAGNASGDRSVILQSPTVVSATAYTASFYLKAATGADVGKQIGIRGVAGVGYGVITLTASWVRYDRTETSASTTGNIELASRGTFTADNTVSVHVWQGQLELGSVATSIIPTVASTANRVADSVTLTGASSLIGQTEGFVAGSFIASAVSGASFRFIFSVDIDGNNAIILRQNVGNELAGVIVFGGATQASFTSSALVAGTTYGFVMSYSAGATLLSLNGVQVGTTDVSATIPANTRINLGQNAQSGAHLNSNMKALILGTTALSLASANALSLSLSTL